MKDNGTGAEFVSDFLPWILFVLVGLAAVALTYSDRRLHQRIDALEL